MQLLETLTSPLCLGGNGLCFVSALPQAAVLSSKFRNLHLWGCWWYCNKPRLDEVDWGNMLQDGLDIFSRCVGLMLIVLCCFVACSIV